MNKNTLLEMPETLEAQKAWAAQVDGLAMDTAYYNLRAVASRRIFAAGIEQAFRELPTLDCVVIKFSGGTVKDSVSVIDQDPANTTKLQTKFDKMMGSVRKRMGQSTNVADTLAHFFGQRQERRITRANHDLCVEMMFDDKAHWQWNDAFDARLAARHLDETTSPPANRRSGPRL